MSTAYPYRDLPSGPAATNGGVSYDADTCPRCATITLAGPVIDDALPHRLEVEFGCRCGTRWWTSYDPAAFSQRVRSRTVVPTGELA